MHLVPWDQDLMSLEYDGLFISNGPGDPSLAKTLIQNVHKVHMKDSIVFVEQFICACYFKKRKHLSSEITFTADIN